MIKRRFYYQKNEKYIQKTGKQSVIGFATFEYAIKKLAEDHTNFSTQRDRPVFLIIA